MVAIRMDKIAQVASRIKAVEEAFDDRNATFQVAASDQYGRDPGTARGWHRRGYLPHFDGGEIPQHIVFRLADSLPFEVIDSIRQELCTQRDELGQPLSAESMRIRLLLLADKYLDQGRGSCVLRNPRAAGILQTALMHFDGVRYDLYDWCVMPNHVHVLIAPRGQWPLGKIVHSWKSFTANKINKALGVSGQLWMLDYFDRYVRNENHFGDIAEYIVHNPVSAGLCKRPWEWEWSSAFGRTV